MTAGPFLSGVLTVARQEFRLRIRAGRWRLLLGLWLTVLTLFTLLLSAAVGRLPVPDRGTIVYGGLTLLVLSLALLVVPSLAAQSVNGDRERGTLAVLQVTRLSPAEIVLGKFAAAWGTGLVFLALSLPLVLVAGAQGGVPLRRVLVVTTVLALLLGSVCAVSLCLSALLARTTTSAVLAYLAVFVLTVGTPVAFGLATALTVERVPVGSCSVSRCGTTERVRTDRTWWLLAPNPFVVLADSSPRLDRGEDSAAGLDPLGGVGRLLREVRQGPQASGADPPSIWPTGLALHALLTAGALGLAVRRLRTPSRELPRGQRVA
jgi:ABC-2 type transport system permease protein